MALFNNSDELVLTVTGHGTHATHTAIEEVSESYLFVTATNQRQFKLRFMSRNRVCGFGNHRVSMLSLAGGAWPSLPRRTHLLEIIGLPNSMGA